MRPDLPRTSAVHVGLGIRPALGLVLFSVGLIAAASARADCLVIEAKDQISIALGGGRAAFLSLYIEDGPDASPAMSTPTSDPMSALARRRCQASIAIPLSAFPTSRLASRPADVARSMRDVAKKHSIEACEIIVRYENDTNDRIADHEICLRETFAFGERKHWSISRERPCWERDDLEITSTEG